VDTRAELAPDVEPDAVLRVVAELEETIDGINHAIGNAKTNEERVVLFEDLGDVARFRRKLMRNLGLENRALLRLRNPYAQRVRPAPVRPRARPRRVARRACRTSRSRGDPHLDDDDHEVDAVAPLGVAA
jgi:hypothetical protein